jgi:hypothetical protein
MSTAQRILAFDIGIKNLAFCILESNRIHRLENTNILTPVAQIACSKCKCNAKFIAQDTHFCARHVPKTFTVVRKAPTATELKELATTAGVQTAKKTKATLLAELSQTHAFPFKQPKQPKASTQSLAELHDALRTFVINQWDDFRHATHVLLENQPAFKNPHMKSVQVLLFATLRERFLQAGLSPQFHLVHAKKKVQDAEAGDAGYAERKSKSEQRVTDLLSAGTISALEPSVLTSWTTMKKKSDMADAVCMCYDYGK